MKYAKMNQLTLPSTGQLSDGRWVSNYNLLPDDILRAEGWKELVEVKPSFDDTTHYLVQDSVVETDVVTVTYRAELIPEDEAQDMTNALTILGVT